MVLARVTRVCRRPVRRNAGVRRKHRYHNSKLRNRYGISGCWIDFVTRLIITLIIFCFLTSFLWRRRWWVLLQWLNWYHWFCPRRLRLQNMSLSCVFLRYCLNEPDPSSYATGFGSNYGDGGMGGGAIADFGINIPSRHVVIYSPHIYFKHENPRILVCNNFSNVIFLNQFIYKLLWLFCQAR